MQIFKYIFVCENPDCGGFVELYKPAFLGKYQNHRLRTKDRDRLVQLWPMVRRDLLVLPFQTSCINLLS